MSNDLTSLVGLFHKSLFLRKSERKRVLKNSPEENVEKASEEE